MSLSWSHARDRDAPKADPGCHGGTGLLQPLWGHFCKTTLCSGWRWGAKGEHPPQLILRASSLPQHSQMLPSPMDCFKKYCFSLECFCLKFPGRD